MFTIRIERGPEREVRECDRYSTRQVEGKRIITLMDANGMQTEQITLLPDASAFVMNAQGKTVDTYRPQTGTRAAQFRTS